MPLPSPLPRLRRLAQASGVSDHDRAKALPGDDLIDDVGLVVDRAMLLPAAPDVVWPWLLQLGKGRAGWYLPRPTERLVPPGRRAARSIRADLQQLHVGDDIDDWGPGDPVFRAVVVDAPHALVYLSLRDRDRGWRWPTEHAMSSPRVLALSWALVLEPVGEHASRLHIRLRVRRGKRALPGPLAVAGGLFDYATIELLRRGLVERLEP